MQKPLIKSKKKGFTIIEVSLVLAIGGLIMLMVFIAWPAVQRNQRDSQRRTVDLPRLYTALVNYQTNNSGKLPSVGTSAGATANITGGETAAEVNGVATNTNADWKKFYTNYMLAQGDTFVDPMGTPYSLRIITCGNTGTGSKPNTGVSAANATCTQTASSGEGEAAVSLFSGGTVTASFDNQASWITIVIGASCKGETAVASTSNTGGARKFAVMYAMESGGVFCQSN